MVDATAALDGTVDSVASSLTSWCRDGEAFMALRTELGRYTKGTRDSLPVLGSEGGRPRGTYGINFQDPEGEPSAEPLVVDGLTFLKVGWLPLRRGAPVRLVWGVCGQPLHRPLRVR